MIMDSLISIIVPVYNGEKTIERTLKAIASQTHKNIEIIVINDASTDKTNLILKKHASSDKRIQIIDLKENQGVHEARMAGLRKSTGQWIGFVDGDDYIHPAMYKTMLSDALLNNVDIVLCSVRRENEQGKLLAYVPKFKKNYLIENKLLEQLTQFKFSGNYLCNRLFSRDIIIEAVNRKYPWRQDLNEDLLINIDCFIKAKRIYLNKNVFYYYVDNKASATATVNKERSYVEHFKAFVLAMHFYGHISEQVQDSLLDIYRTQISQKGMHIDNTQLLEKFENELTKAVEMLNKEHPLALVKLAARNSKNCPQFLPYRQRIINLFIRIANKLFFKNKDSKYF